MEQKEILEGKMNNLTNYLAYCESLKSILEQAPNNLNHKNQINKLNNIDRGLNDIDLYVDFFDEMSGILSEFETKNKEIKKKIDELKR